ncbi:MAG: hypothetical protein QXJ72_06390 [Thermoproteota archaeon]
MLYTDNNVGIKDRFSYGELVKIRLKAYRNGSWRKLTHVEKALFKASIELAKLRGIIVSPSLVNKLKSIVSKLLKGIASKILQLGREYAGFLLSLYGRNGVLKAFPVIKDWLGDHRYLLWLGTKQLLIKNIGWI